MEKKSYKFSELTDSAKSRAVSNMRDKENYIENLVGHNWFEEEINCFLEKIELMGYSISYKDVQFNGFWSQGDGASFTGEVDPVMFYKRKFLSASTELDDVFNHAPEYLNDSKNDIIEYLKDYCSISLVRTSHHYCHENTVSVNVDYGDESEYNSILTTIEDSVLNEARSLMKELYSNLEKLYDELRSDKNIKIDLDDHDQLFYEDGSLASVLESLEGWHLNR